MKTLGPKAQWKILIHRTVVASLLATLLLTAKALHKTSSPTHYPAITQPQLTQKGVH